MYIEASKPRKPGDKARLLSPVNQATTGACLQFWYHMYGSNIGQLTVYAKSLDSLGVPVWKLAGNQGNRWQLAQVTVKSPSTWQVSAPRRTSSISVIQRG